MNNTKQVDLEAVARLYKEGHNQAFYSCISFKNGDTVFMMLAIGNWLSI